MPKKRRTSRTAGPVKEERVELRMSPADKKAISAAAKSQGLTFSHWLRLAAWRVIHEHDGKVELIAMD